MRHLYTRLSWPRSMLSTIQRTIRTHALVAGGDLVIVAVSGGLDSMALLHALAKLAPRLGFGLEVATVDHGLRRRGARRGRARARARRGARPRRGTASRVDVAAARKGRASLQDAARRVRLGALEALAARRGARVALAHQADDQAETVLFRVVRGTGLAGLGGHPVPARSLHAPAARCHARRGPRATSRGTRSAFVEDPSNADPRFARARIRHRLLPLLAAENPRVREALVALAAAARAHASRPGATLPDDIGRRAADVIAGLRARGGGTRRIDVSGRRVVEVAYGRVRVGGARRPRRRASRLRQPVVVPDWRHLCARGRRRRRCASAPRASRRDRRRAVRRRRARVAARASRAAPGRSHAPARRARAAASSPTCSSTRRCPRAARDALPVLTTADDVVLFVPGLRPAEQGAALVGDDALPRCDGRERYPSRCTVPPLTVRNMRQRGDESRDRDIKRVFDPHPIGGNTF